MQFETHHLTHLRWFQQVCVTLQVIQYLQAAHKEKVAMLFKLRIFRDQLKDSQMEHIWDKTWQVNMDIIIKSNQLIVKIQLIKINKKLVVLHRNIVVIVDLITHLHKNLTKRKLLWTIQRIEVLAELVDIQVAIFLQVVEGPPQQLTQMWFHLKYMNNNK